MQATFRYAVHRGVAGDTYATAGILNFLWLTDAGVTRIIELTTWDNPALIIMSYNGTDYGDQLEVDQDDPPLQFPHAARAVQIMNAVAGNNARYQIAGFW
jgi:hypothetical protein